MLASPVPYRRRARAALALAAVVLLGCDDVLLPETPAVCPEPLPGRAASPAADAPPLFELVSAPALTPEQEHFLGVIRGEPTTAGVHLARLAEGAAALLEVDRAIRLDVSPAQRFTAVGRRVERRAADDVSWSGRIAGENGDVTLVLTGRGVTGTLQVLPFDAAPATYSIRPLGGGLQAIVCVDQSKLPPDH